MELTSRKITIQSLQAQIVLRQLLCAPLAQQFETKGLTFAQRANLAHRWDDLQTESQVLKLVRDLLERRARAEKETIEFGAPAPGFTSLESDSNHPQSVQTPL